MGSIVIASLLCVIAVICGFFLYQSSLMFINFVDLSKEPTLALLIFFIVCLFSMSSISVLIFISFTRFIPNFLKLKIY